MKLFTKKKNIQKIIIAFVVLILINFILPTYSHASDASLVDWAVRPIVFLITSIFDACNNLLARFMIGTGIWSDIYVTDSITNGLSNEERDALIKANPDQPELPTIVIAKQDLFGDYGYPNIKYTPAQIFSGKVASLDVNFFRTNEEREALNLIGADQDKSIVEALRNVVSSWYTALRDLAVVGLLSVLAYLGIRIIITSSNAEKAKYKQSFVDWLIAMCLVFFLHYIMAFTLTVTDLITNMILNNDDTNNIKEVNIRIVDAEPIEGVEEIPSVIHPDKEGNDNLENYINIEHEDPMFSTTLMGAARIQVEYKSASMKLGFMIIYGALTIYTLMFTYTYLKRLLTMTFLTLIAPLVALTYPLDKIGDSKAQAFSFWVKEYVYNALMQPIHLLIYTVLLGSALSLAATNMIYALVALAFIIPAEKILKTMFNIKASTSETLGAFAGGMVAKSALDRFAKGGKKAPQQKGKDKIRTADTPKMKDPNAPKAYDALKTGTMPGDTGATSEGDSSGGILGGSTPTGADPMLSGGDTSAGDNSLLGGAAGLAGAQNYTAQTPSGILVNPNAAQRKTPSGTTAPSGAMSGGGATGGTGGGFATGGASSSSVTPSTNVGVNTNRGIKLKKNPIRGIRKYADRKFRDAGGASGIMAKAGKGVLKGYAKGAATLAGASIGLAAGITGGDLSDMGKGLIAGAYSGSAIGDGIINRASGIEEMASQIGRYSYADDDEYVKDQLDKQEKKFINNSENRDYFENKFKNDISSGNMSLDDVMNQAATFNRSGIIDLDRISDSIKLENRLAEKLKGTDSSQEDIHNQAVILSKMDEKIPDDVMFDPKKLANRTDALAKSLMAGNNAVSEKEAKKRAKFYMDTIEEQRRNKL